MPAKNMDPARVARRIERWRAEPDKSASAVLGTRLLRGRWVTEAAAADAGASVATLYSVLSDLRAAGYGVERETRPDGTKRYRLDASAAKPRRRTVSAEVPGLTYPAIGAQLTVRGLVLGSDGALQMQLSNGRGAWVVTVAGHVE